MLTPAEVIIGSAFASGVGLGVAGFVRGLIGWLLVRRRLTAWRRTTRDDVAGGGAL